MNAINWKRLLLPNIPYLLFVYLFDKVGQAVRLAPGADLSGKVLSLGEGFSMAFANPLPSLAPMDLLIGIFGAVLIRLIVYVKGKNAKKYRKGVEYGSARWGNAEDIKPYTDPVFQNNVLLTQTERLTMNSRPKQPKYARNKNILVIGGSGSGKTRFFVKPNLMQMHSSYVVTDPKGTVLVECGKLLQRGGYRIKVLNTINFKKSMKYKADDEYGGRLPVHVRCLLDEFANIGQIPKFEKLIATIRSREISASIILQSQSQLKAIYKDNADTIVGNCDTTLFLGGKEKTTLKEMSEILGKETIDSFNTSENRGREVSHGLNYQKLGKQLMTEDEIAVMDGGKCILQLRGVRPFFSDKYDITKHPNYKYLSDYDKKNTFDMEKHLRRRPTLVKPDEPFDYYEISEADLQEDTDHE